VNSAVSTLPSASARRIVEVAERLFALHGIDGVSLRQIAAAAGTANNSAVNYHFGSKEGLIAAIFQYRLPQLTSERKMLAARCDPDDLRSRFEAYYLPVLHIAEATDNHYVSFVEQLQRRWVGSGASAASTGMLPNLPTEGQHSIEDFRSDLERLLPHLNMPLRRIRIATAMSTSRWPSRTTVSEPGQCMNAGSSIRPEVPVIRAVQVRLVAIAAFTTASAPFG